MSASNQKDQLASPQMPYSSRVVYWVNFLEKGLVILEERLTIFWLHFLLCFSKSTFWLKSLVFHL
jgi:hypothetical protein